MFFGKKESPFLCQIFCTSYCQKSPIFLWSDHSTCSQKQSFLFKNILIKLSRETMWPTLWRGVRRGWFPYNPFPFKQRSRVQVLMLRAIVSKLLTMFFKTIFGFILSLLHIFSCSYQWQFWLSSTRSQILSRAKLFKLLYNWLYLKSWNR